MKWDGLLQRITHGRCPCHCDHRTNNYEKKEEVNQEEKKSVLKRYTQVFFFNKNYKKENGFFFETMESGNLFCFWKNDRKWESKEEIWTTESTNKDVLDHKKETLCFPSFRRIESVSLCWKVENRKDNILRKGEFSRNDASKKKT